MTEALSTDVSIADPSVARPAAIGAAIGFVFATVAVTVVGTIAGLGFGQSLGLGAFIGIWSGVGAGFMFGATIPFARHFDAVHANPSTTSDKGDQQ